MKSFWQYLKHQKKPFLVLAPLDGVTDFVFREIIAETAKPDVFFTEFTNTDALQSAGFNKTIIRFKFSQKQRYIVAQIWGSKPENFCKTARLVKDLSFDGIDINMGCPVENVMKIGCGASLIENPNLAAEIIKATKAGAAGVAVSVKTRIGLNSIVTDSWIKFLLEQKLDALTIHARTAAELSQVPPHWQEIKKVVRLRDQISPDTVVIGNGDITSMKKAQSASKEYGVDGVMIGRGIFLNPWIFEKIPTNHTSQKSLNILLKHTKLYCDAYPDKNRFSPIKKFFKIYMKSFPGAKRLKIQLMETKNLPEVEKIIQPLVTMSS